MPLILPSFQLPLTPSLPYILEDVYLKGGYRSVATLDAMNAIHPAARKLGMLVYCVETDLIYKPSADKTSFVEWSGGGGSVGGGGATRHAATIPVGELVAGASVDIVMTLEAASAMVLELSIDVPQVMVQIFAAPDMQDTNPYTFVSTAEMLQDDGMTLIDGALLKGRRFALLATEDGGNAHYLRVTNLAETDTLTPTVTLKYLKLE